MTNLLIALKNDDHGFIVSAELVLVATIGVLALIVGMAEISHGVNQEMEDVGSAVGNMNQSYEFSGFTGYKGRMVGSDFHDNADECDLETDITCDLGPADECDRVFDNDPYYNR